MSYKFSFVVIAFLLIAQTGPAFAYIDPGTASIALQALIGGVVSALFVVRLYWQKIKRFFVGSSASDKPGEPQPDDD